MEVITFSGKRKRSIFYKVESDQNNIYKNHYKRDKSLYVKCIRKRCDVHGRIKEDRKFYYTSNSTVHKHDNISDEFIACAKFYNDLKTNAAENEPKQAYDDAWGK